MRRSIRRILDSERWKYRHPPIALAVIAPTPAERARIARWVGTQVITWTPDNCFHCRRSVVFGSKWVELVNETSGLAFISIARLCGERGRKSSRLPEACI
jgi:hypothetical protein